MPMSPKKPLSQKSSPISRSGRVSQPRVDSVQHMTSLSDRIGQVRLATQRFRNVSAAPCSRCSRQNQPCLIDSGSSRCKACRDAHKSCDLRVFFEQFDALARKRSHLRALAKEADEEAEMAEREALTAIADAQNRMSKARQKARERHQQLWTVEHEEDAAYRRETASIEAIEGLTTANSAAVSTLAYDPNLEQMPIDIFGPTSNNVGQSFPEDLFDSLLNNSFTSEASTAWPPWFDGYPGILQRPVGSQDPVPGQNVR